MVYSYANSGRLGDITRSEDNRQVVDEAKADEFIAAFVANRQAGGTGVREPKAEKAEGADATPSESDELEDGTEDESDEDESDDEGLVEAE
jgi:TATA-binding protein-associated factor Taf7